MRTLAAIVVAACALLLPADALADGDIAIIGDALFVSYGDQTPAFALLEQNENGNRNYVLDEEVPITAHAPCAVLGVPANRDYECPGEGLFKVVVALGQKDDLFSLHQGVALDAVVQGERGNDQIFAADGDDQLEGNKGDDEVDGGRGRDVLSDGTPTSIGGSGGDDGFFGGPDDDYLAGGQLRHNADSGSGGDVMDGGTGNDVVDYSQRTAPLSITEGAGTKDDGQLGEGDDVSNVETILAGSAGDVVIGDAGPDTIHGGGGPDALGGGGGADLLLGEAGDDTLLGGLGADVLQGGNGIDTASYLDKATPVTATLDGLANDGTVEEEDSIDDGTENIDGGGAGDRLTGNGGPNRLRGLGGVDVLRGVGGDDTIDARDGGPDTIGCGTGVDRVLGDLADVVPADCESAKAAGRSLKRLKLGGTVPYSSGHARVTITCPKNAPGGCAGGRAAVVAGGKQLGSATWSSAAGKATTASVPVSAAALGSRAKVTVVAVCHGAIGASRTAAVKR